MKIRNDYLINTFNLLQGYKATGRQARALSRFKKILDRHIQQFSEDELEVVKRYAVKNEEGEVKFTEDGGFQFIPETMEEGVNALEELRKEEIIITIEEFKPFIETFLDFLDNSDRVLEGNEMDVLDELVIKLENENMEEN